MSVLVLQRQIPAYRRPFVLLLAQRLGALTVASGDESDPFHGQPVRWVPAPCRGRHRVVWQRLPLAALREADLVLGELNPRLISSWLLVLIGRVGRRRTLLWGHREGRDGRLRPPRRLLGRLATAVVYYTPAEAHRDERAGRGGRRFVATNSLATRYVPATGTRRDLVFSGRLAAEKDPLLAVRAVALMTRPRPALHVLGDGPLRAEVLSTAGRLGVRVHLYGEVFDEDHVARVYARCYGAVSPGYVGLNLNQALLSGVRMVYRADRPHAPEISYLDPTNSLGVAGDEPWRWAAALDRLRDGVDEAAVRTLAAHSHQVIGLDRMVDEMVGAIGALAPEAVRRAGRGADPAGPVSARRQRGTPC